MNDRNESAQSPEDVAAVVAALVGAGWQWWWSVVNELQHLPEVLRQMREGAESFEQVAKQLANSTAMFEQIVEVYGKTLLEAAERNAAMTDAMRQRLEGLAALNSPDAVSDTVAEMQKIFGTLAQLNPLWPSQLVRRPGDTIDDTDSR